MYQKYFLSFYFQDIVIFEWIQMQVWWQRNNNRIRMNCRCSSQDCAIFKTGLGSAHVVLVVGVGGACRHRVGDPWSRPMKGTQIGSRSWQMSPEWVYNEHSLSFTINKWRGSHWRRTNHLRSLGFGGIKQSQMTSQSPFTIHTNHSGTHVHLLLTQYSSDEQWAVALHQWRETRAHKQREPGNEQTEKGPLNPETVTVLTGAPLCPPRDEPLVSHLIQIHLGLKHIYSVIN